MTSTDFQLARRNMVDYQIRCCKILEPSILDLIETMPRENFVPENVRSLAYMEGHVPLPCHQEMLTPLQEANILQHLMLDGSERILEIGTGTGFLTAMLAMQAKEVISCEIHNSLAEQAIENIDKHGISNARVINVNAMDADALAAQADMEEAFDIIILTAAVTEIPPHFGSMLNNNGQIMAFVGQNPVVSLVHKRKVGHVWQESSITETLLLDMEGLSENRKFIF